MNKWLFLLDALRKGVRLTNADTWKTGQALSAVVVGVVIAAYSFAMAAGWVTWDISESTLAEIGTAVAALLYTLYQTYTTIATSKKVGVLPAPTEPVTDARLRDSSSDAVSPDPDGRRKSDGGYPSGPFFE